MIIDDTILVTWNINNKDILIENGYKFTKIRDIVEIKIEHLNKNSNYKINVKCDICGNEKYLEYRKYYKNIKNGGYYSCCQKCSNNKSKQTKHNLYNDENYNNRNKYKITNLENFGVENPSQNDTIKNKKIITSQKNYNVKYPILSEIIKNKLKNTNLEKYGYEYPWQNKNIKDKVDNTIFEKYGVKYPSQNKYIMNKIIKTQIDRYGEIWKNNIPRYNPKSIIYLDIISQKLNLKIKHALNGGEKKIIKYWIDGYIEEYNICIEWDERHHKNNKIYDNNREDYLKNNFNCHFVRIDEDEFLKNIDDGITNAINDISQIINSF